MLFDISDLAPEGAVLDLKVAIAPFSWEGGESVQCDPVHLAGRIRLTRRGYEFRGTFRTAAQLTCGRCLGPCHLDLGGEFRLFLVPEGTPEEGPQFETIPEDDDEAIDLFPIAGRVVDLAALLREQVDLVLPIRVLCREDCRGLCPGCGADLNNEPCRCSPKSEERWGDLLKLKEKLEGRKDSSPSGRK